MQLKFFYSSSVKFLFSICSLIHIHQPLYSLNLYSLVFPSIHQLLLTQQETLLNHPQLIISNSQGKLFIISSYTKKFLSLSHNWGHNQFDISPLYFSSVELHSQFLLVFPAYLGNFLPRNYLSHIICTVSVAQSCLYHLSETKH